ncbi:MAG: hypothetical protein AB8B63_14750 [Granulosicoccus sp.]
MYLKTAGETNRLCIVTALPAETRPFLDKWHGKALSLRGLRAYECQDYLLVQTGLGKLNAAASVAAMLQAHPEIHCIVNIGIAGARLTLGTLLLAHSVCDEATGQRWFPHLPDPRELPASLRSMPTGSIVSVDQPNTDYQKGYVFDMEASGLFAAATRHLSSSQVQCIKIVSDNPDAPITVNNKKLLARQAQTLLNDRIEQIEAILDYFATQGSPTDNKVRRQAMGECEKIAQAVHHTHSETVLLIRQIEQLISLETDPQTDQCLRMQTATEVRLHLEKLRSAATLSYA